MSYINVESCKDKKCKFYGDIHAHTALGVFVSKPDVSQECLTTLPHSGCPVCKPLKEKEHMEYKTPCKEKCQYHRYHCGNCNTALSYSPANFSSRLADIPNPCQNCQPPSPIKGWTGTVPNYGATSPQPTKDYPCTDKNCIYPGRHFNCDNCKPFPQPQSDWEDEFYRLTKTMDGQYRPQLRKLIENLLKSQREEIVGKIDKQLKGNYNPMFKKGLMTALRIVEGLAILEQEKDHE